MQLQQNLKRQRKRSRKITIGCFLPYSSSFPNIEMNCLGTTQFSTASDKWRQDAEDNFKSNSQNRLRVYQFSRDTVIFPAAEEQS